ncbi:helix-turn-helix domain-containing protein [Hylemonella sp. W303a]|uniref:AraC family transcriptional regulator n=1 Tax=Hylemonella sp. W303a TaxID=3389873 RepID=UPI00396B382A
MSRADTQASALPTTVLARWQFTAVDDRSTTVLPDGCRDLILNVDALGRPQWHVSALTDATVDVPGHAGEHWLGYRLQPGALLNEDGLLRAMRSMRASGHDGLAQRGQRKLSSEPWSGTSWHPPDWMNAELERRVLAALEEHTRLDPCVQEALHTLAHAHSVRHAVKALGVSQRGLERLTQQATARPPRFWLALARVRRAVRDLGTARPLAEIAADHGYADQAHFSRECRRWLGQSPSMLRRHPLGLMTATEAGYG